MVTISILKSSETLFKYLCLYLQDIKILVQEKALKKFSKKKSYNFSPPTSLHRCTK